MPISAPSWTDFLICPICTHEFEISFRAPITLACGHTICKNCLATLHRKQCPFDQTNITKDLDNLPINYALLQLVPSSTSSNNIVEHEILPSIIQTLTAQDLQYYKSATRCIEELALYLRPSSNISALLSRPMQRKLVTLINCQLIEDEGRARSLRAARSLGERTVTELILQHQNPQLLSTHLWAAVRARGCQFLGPAMQEEVLKLVLLALEDGSSLSRKVLVLYVVSQLVTTFPQASKTSIGHVVQLLYRASCFKVSKRESDSSLMTLKEEFRTYEALRREHDAQIVQIATEAGLRIAPDQWSALLYGDNNHKSHMQSIIDKQQNPSSFALSVHELVLALQRTGDPANLSRLRNHMDNLAIIDSSSEPSIIPTWIECANALDSVKQVVNGLIDFIQHHGNRKTQENAYLQNTSRYKVSFCRELQNHGNCARGQNCNFAHSDEELERYRAKYKKNTMRNSQNSSLGNGNNGNNNNNNGNSNNNNGSSGSNNQMKESNNFNASNGPNQKVNMNHHSTFAKNNQDNSRFNKSMSYRNEHHHSMTPNNSNHHHHHHSNHLKPTNVYSNSSSTSTPNLSLPLSPSQHKMHSSNGPRFAFNGNSPNYNSNNNNNNNYSSSNFLDSQHPNLSAQPGKFLNRPPLSAPPITQQNYVKSADFKKQLSPYHGHNNNMPNAFSSPTHNMNNNNHFSAMKSPNNANNNNGGYYGMQQQPPTHFFNNHVSPYNNNNNNSSNDECNTSSSSSASFGGDQKYVPWNRGQEKQQQQPKSPNNLMPKSPTTSQQFNKPANASPINRFDVSPNHDYNNKHRNQNVNQMNMVQPSNYVYHPKNNVNNDETDGMTNMWNYQQFNQPQSSPQVMKTTAPYHFTPTNTTMMSGTINKDKFIRSDSILTANTDDSYDNLPTNGKYGAIGLKNSDMNVFKANQWSGLQQTVLSSIDNNNFDIGSTSSGSGNDSFKSIDLARSIDTKKSNDAHLNIGSSVNQNSQHSLNEHFLNMTISDINISSANASNDFWSNDSLKWNESKKDVDSLGNDMWKSDLWNFIDE
ncbi:homeobox protein 2 isoform X2 [Chironomus tepperi]